VSKASCRVESVLAPLHGWTSQPWHTESWRDSDRRIEMKRSERQAQSPQASLAESAKETERRENFSRAALPERPWKKRRAERLKFIAGLKSHA
jgi:hypothetical protein